jgi:predicted metalloprotease
MALPSYEEYQQQFEQRKSQQEAELAELGYKRVGNKFIKIPTQAEAYSDELSTKQKELDIMTKSKALEEGSSTEQAAQRSEQFVSTLLDQLEDLSSKVNTSGYLPMQYLRSFKAAVAPDSEPDAAELESKKAFLAPLVRQLGEKGNLSDSDIQRAINAIPLVTDTKIKAQRKMKTLREFFNKPEITSQQETETGQTSGRFQIVEE